jgi:hypothetical protein
MYEPAINELISTLSSLKMRIIGTKEDDDDKPNTYFDNI